MSSSSLSRLISVLPPPPNSNEAFTEQKWQWAETQLGQALPVDYKQWVEIYGYGCISDWLWIADPLPTKHKYHNIFGRTELTREAKTIEVSDELGKKISAFEILTIGCDINGNLLHWHMIGDSNNWPLIYASLDGMDCDRFDLSLTEFLYCWVSGLTIPAVLAHDDLFKKKGGYFKRIEVRN